LEDQNTPDVIGFDINFLSHSLTVEISYTVCHIKLFSAQSKTLKKTYKTVSITTFLITLRNST
jgi:hypothetical protein